MEPTGFLGGLSSGLVAAVLSNKKKEDDEFHALRENRAKQLSALADHIRPEDLPALMQGLDGVLTAKKPEQADAAYGSVMAKFIQERYDQEQQGQQYNQSIDQASQDRSAETVQLAPTQSGTSDPGTIAGQPEGSTKLGMPLAYARPDTTQSASPAISLAPSQDATPVKVNPTAYAQDKIRIQTEEGKMGRAVKLYAAKEAALYKEKTAFEEKRQDEIRETNKQKIETAAKNAGIKILGRFDDENGDAAITYKDPSTGDITTKSFPGAKWPSEVTTEMKIKSQKELQDARLKANETKWKAQLQESTRMHNARIKDIESKITERQKKIESGYYERASVQKAASNVITRYKALMDNSKSQLKNVQTEIDTILRMDPDKMSQEDKEKAIAPLRDRQAKLGMELDVNERLMEVELSQIDQTSGGMKGISDGGSGKVTVKPSGTSGSSGSSSGPRTVGAYKGGKF